MDLVTTVRRGARQFSESSAVACEGETQTYERLYERSCRLANALAGLGVRRGDRVATLNDNRLESVELMAGIALGGFVRTALYTHGSPESNVYLLDLVEASTLIVEARHHAALAPHLDGIRALRHVIVLDGPARAGTHEYERCLAAATATDPGIRLADDEPHVIRFSAGTTGKPKGILHTVAGWRAVGTEIALVMPRLDEDDRYLGAGPLSHAAMLPLFPTLAAGGTVEVMRQFHPLRFLEVVASKRCTTTLLVPTMIQMIVGLPEARAVDLSSLRAVLYGAAPISERTLNEARGVWGDVMYQVYGQSEAVPLTVLSPRDHVAGGPDQRSRLRSAGRPTPNTVIRILDGEGNELPAGRIGEVVATSPTAMAQIWRDPVASAERILPDGSVCTRDMGYLDEDGFLYLADRKEDMIISGGYNIWPAELENALAAHPAVREVAVVGVPHDRWGETPKAVIVLREGHAAGEEELIDWTRDRLGAVKRVTSVEFVGDLPKTPLGKVLRRAVRERYWEGAERGVAGA